MSTALFMAYILLINAIIILLIGEQRMNSAICRVVK